MSVIIRKAQASDTGEILTLLSELNNNGSGEKWRPFFNRFDAPGEPYYGYVLEVDQKIEGFLGTQISERIYVGKKWLCCNLHGWIVRHEHKSQSLKMINEVLKEDMVFTNFTSMEITYQIFKRLKFKQVDHQFAIYRPNLFSILRHGRGTEPSFFSANLSNEERRIFEAHQAFKVEFARIFSGNEHCFIVFKPEKYRPEILKYVSFLIPDSHFRLLKIEYISNPIVFQKSFKKESAALAGRLKCLGFIAPKAILETAGIHKLKKYFGQRKYLYRFPAEAGDSFVPDTLYSEMFILNHPG